MTTLTDITTLDEAGLLGAIDALGAPAYRVRQIVRWLYSRGASSFDEMTDLPKELRATLSAAFTVGRPTLLGRQESRDGTRKYLWRLAGGATVESVGLPSRSRLTVCFSTQAGCGMGCSFCATGRGGLSRDLTPGEIAMQVGLVGDDFARRVSNAVAMGQGEPFANYDATLGGLRLLNSSDALGIGARHLTVSTCGLIAGIDRFAGEPEQFTLAVSLHSAVQTTRDRLMPGVRGDRLPELRAALVRYSEITGRRPSLEYALMSGVNDTEEESAALVAWCRGLLAHVNLIPVNALDGTGLERSDDRRVQAFRAALEDARVKTSVRAERGGDIAAACGQLRQHTLGGPETGHVAP